jgi:AcrR family transcriptional regulator
MVPFVNVRESPMRADAARNRKLIVEAARALFATDGLAASVDDIAQRARVGVGTFYRHFPTKEALFEAVLMERIQLIACGGEQTAAASDPATAFFDALAQLMADSRGKKDLLAAIQGQGIDPLAASAGMLDEMWARIGRLMARAQEIGVVRNEVRLEDLKALIAAACLAVEQRGGDQNSEGVVWMVIRDGLRKP